MRYNDPEFQNDQRSSLKSMPKAKKDEVIFQGITFILTPYTHGYVAATTNLPGIIGKGGSERSAIGDLIIRNQDSPE